MGGCSTWARRPTPATTRGCTLGWSQVLAGELAELRRWGSLTDAEYRAIAGTVDPMAGGGLASRTPPEVLAHPLETPHPWGVSRSLLPQTPLDLLKVSTTSDKTAQPAVALELKRLAELHRKGKITDEECARAKHVVLYERGILSTPPVTLAARPRKAEDGGDSSDEEESSAGGSMGNGCASIISVRSQAPGEATQPTDASMAAASRGPILAEMVAAMRLELGVDGNVTQVVAQACGVLNVPAEGNLKLRAERCYEQLPLWRCNAGTSSVPGPNAATAEVIEDDTESEPGSSSTDSGSELVHVLGSDGMIERTDVSQEVAELFAYITHFTPSSVELDPVLKPFIPDFIPAISEVDAGLRLPRPDGQFCGLGIVRVAEPPQNEYAAASPDTVSIARVMTALRTHRSVVVG